ncbi:MAG: hypothetical protein IV107_25145 [Paucibacter sp.]|nr:hypothetical protein [Roseateles sp.]
MSKYLINRAARVAVVSSLLLSSGAHAGADVSGPVEIVQIAPDGKIWFRITNQFAASFCLQGWNNLNMYIPSGHPEYPYYFAMLMTSVSKGKAVYIANISTFNGSTACDITKTGYGLVLAG